jgi:hypothetical protein
MGYTAISQNEKALRKNREFIKLLKRSGEANKMKNEEMTLIFI